LSKSHPDDDHHHHHQGVFLTMGSLVGVLTDEPGASFHDYLRDFCGSRLRLLQPQLLGLLMCFQLWL
jgi:hypothetical protein